MRVLTLFFVLFFLSACSVDYTTAEGRPIVIGLINWVQIKPEEKDPERTDQSDFFGVESYGISLMTAPSGGSLNLGYIDFEIAAIGSDACYVAPHILRRIREQNERAKD